MTLSDVRARPSASRPFSSSKVARYAPAGVLLPALLAAALSGCAGSSTQPSPARATPAGPDEPWFCQMDEMGGWDCVQDRHLAEHPVPDRLPRPQPTDPADLGRFTPPPASPATEPATRMEPASSASEAERAVASEPQTAGRMATEPADAATEQAPAYARLAYQPEEPTALMDLPADFYAVQLMAMSKAETLEAYVEAMGLPGLSAARVERDGEPFYVLLLGVYRSRADAETAIEELPAPLEEFNPWIRRLGSLQAAMLRAEALSE